jgi:hypothetical protein
MDALEKRPRANRVRYVQVSYPQWSRRYPQLPLQQLRRRQLARAGAGQYQPLS